VNIAAPSTLAGPSAVDPERLARLQRSLAERLLDPSVTVAPFRAGVDCFVDLVARDGHPPAVVRSARVELLPTRYEGIVDFGKTLRKEVVVAQLLRESGVPVPALLHWYRTDDPAREPSWMLSEFVAHAPCETLTAGAQRELGRIARMIHRIEPTQADLEAFDCAEPWTDWIVGRIQQRIDAARRYIVLPDRAQVEWALRAALAGREPLRRSLLHLDLRPPNLAVERDDIVAIFDYANAVYGDPYLELARLKECGLLTPAFLEGYALDQAEVDRRERILTAYGLDLTALLVVVSTEEFDDPRLHDEMAAKTSNALTTLMVSAGRGDPTREALR
jgi:aminoglycoside phosphotransferase (APT) family kinase protein